MAEPRRKRLVGVLGGMGPAATVDFMAKVIAATPAMADQDHVPLVVYQVPQIPSRTAAVAEGSDAPLPAMLAGIRVLEGAGAEVIVIPCNTAHYWYEPLASATLLEIIHIADAVHEILEERVSLQREVGIMATRATLGSSVFQGRLPDVRFVAPSEGTQRLIDEVIETVKSGQLERARRLASTAARNFMAEGAEILLLACTELPIALERESGLDFIDSTEALARACVAACFDTVDLLPPSGPSSGVSVNKT